MSSLQISDNQKSTILDPIDAMLDSAFRDGVTAPSTPSVLPKMERYADLQGADQTSIRVAFKQVVAALIKAINMDTPGGGGGGSVTLTGDVTGSGTGSITTTLASVATPGTSTKVTYDAKGRITSGTTLVASDIPNLDWGKITSGKPTSLAGYGITDAAPLSHVGATGAAHGVATTAVDGFMSKADKAKLDGLQAWLPGTPVYRHDQDSNTALTRMTDTPLNFSTTWYQSGSNAALSSWAFTPPQSGVYHVDVSVKIDTKGLPATECYLSLWWAGAMIKKLWWAPGVPTDVFQAHGSADVILLNIKGNVLEVKFFHDAASDWLTVPDSDLDYIDLHLVRQTDVTGAG